MKKKIVLILLNICLCIAVIAAFVACDKGCEHEFGDWQTVQESTCAEFGTKSRKCGLCDEVETQSIDKKPHNLRFLKEDVHTCSQYRYTESCLDCGETVSVIKDESAVGAHNYVDNVCLYCNSEFPSTAVSYFSFTLLEDDTYSISATNVNVMPSSVVIPSSYNDKPITSIVAGAFAGCSNLINLTVGFNVTEIQDSAFYGCANLMSVTIGSGVTHIGQNAFAYCAKLSSLKIATGVTHIAKGAFAYCSSLVNVTVPKSVTDIQAGAFSYCKSLANITVNADNENYVSIGESLYTNGGATLVQYAVGKINKEFIIPESVTDIAEGAFAECASLKSVILPDGLTSIGEYAFRNCSNITFITIPESVTAIEQEAFLGCYNLMEVNNKSLLTVEAGSAANGHVGYYALNVYTPDNGASKIRTDGLGFIIYEKSADEHIIIGYENNAVSLTVPENVTQINAYAFYGCTSIKLMIITDNVKVIGESAFESCPNLTTVVIGAGVERIDDRAFYGCTALTQVELGESVSQIAQCAFDGCYKLVEVYNKSGLTVTAGDWKNGYVGFYAMQVFNDYSQSKLEVDKDGYVIYINGEERILIGYEGDKKVLTLPESVTQIYKYAFFGQDRLTAVSIPNNITVIGDYAFSGCTNLVTLLMPGTVTDIGKNVFLGCNSLNYNSYNNAYYLGNSSNPYVVLVSNKSVNITACEISPNTRIIYSMAFSGCTELKNITIPSRVISIGESAFAFCFNLAKLTIGEGVASIGDGAFKYCTALTSVTIPRGVKTIGDSAFYNCSNIASLTIGDGVSSIGDWAFLDCAAITSVTIPSSVKHIGESAFYGCAELEEVSFEDANGWWISESYTANGGTNMSSTDLADAQTAAEYLTEAYSNFYWHNR